MAKNVVKKVEDLKGKEKEIVVKSSNTVEESCTNITNTINSIGSSIVRFTSQLEQINQKLQISKERLKDITNIMQSYL